MNSFFYLLPVVLAIAQGSLASFPSSVVEEEPAVAVAPESPAQVLVGPAHAAPVVAPASVIAPMPYHPHVYPHAVFPHYYHPRTEVRNVVKGYAKETGHRSETQMVSEDGHLPTTWGIHPAEHLAEALAFPTPFRSRLHRKKMAKKTSRAHKSLNNRKN
ncbi:hypothetical protein Y032_0183g933 [Ancylostoma ceylanicum]|uniref:Uncharacterized protein n=1 Tax=Ancylostoma ceylanicum TaxID=53326 RepID=A0A016SSP3_9BILA|nr:hypothetical protein Y032_0183g933 [Ancylostoma ceylanicum]